MKKIERSTNDSDNGTYVDGEKPFERDMRYVTTRITKDGRDGFTPEAGRYHLVAARACPWANRTLIVRRLLGLEDAISIGLPGPTHDKNSWTFDLDDGAAIRLSTKMYLTAMRTDISNIGVTPDIIIYNSDPSTVGTTSGTTGGQEGTASTSEDEQLMEALRYLS